MERRSGLWLLLEEETEEKFSLVSQNVSSAAGSDITHCDTPVEPDSTSSLLPSAPPSETPPSTASFVTTPDSAPDRDTVLPVMLTPVGVMGTAAQRHALLQHARGRGSFDDISPELPPKKPLLLQERGAEPEEEGAASEGVRRRRRQRGARSLPPRLLLPPLQGGGRALLLQLKGLREAPSPVQVGAEGGGARALWRSVFSGNRKEKKWGGTLPAERVKKDPANQRRAADARGGLTEESDLDSSDLLQRCSLKPRNNRRSRKDRVPLQDSEGRSSCTTEVVGVLVQPKEPSSLSVKEETMFQRGREDEDLDAKITRRVQRAVRRKAKQEQLKRLHKAQMIQRQLQQVEEKQRQLEERGVMVEKALRGEADYWGDNNDGQDIELHLGGLGKLDNPALMQQWFQLVQQKNSLVRYESELMIFARELELEDRQSRLQQELRERMAVDDHLKEDWELLEERLILEEMLEVVEQRDSLVSLLEEQRVQERQEDQDLEEVMMNRGMGLSWT
ncbi:protein-methionine sulfoxide oxidase mical3a [Micropterus dolomieu]|uniref:protein-methionine sulfoxide oxidase mical3a n=2 Tax=Micropterus TaxID=27705 RepID=UPI001E8E0B51|nr:protein-methionine sulfoxide oxidase mical3a [Micropterus dolomieu]